MTGYMPTKDTACFGIAWLLQRRCHPNASSCLCLDLYMLCLNVYVLCLISHAVQVDADMMAYIGISALLQQQLHCGGVAMPSC